MINGVHALIYSKKADEVRAFFQDVLKYPWVDAGHGWLVFALPPAEHRFVLPDRSPEQVVHSLREWF